MLRNVVTYQDPSGNTINITPKQERAFTKLGQWPKNAVGREYCQVSKGLHIGEPSPYVILETMPDHKGSHEGCGNWGKYPANGAVRKVCLLSEAKEAVEADASGYAWIVDDFELDN